MKTSIRWQVGSAAVALLGLTVGPIAVAQIEINPRLQVRQTWTDTANLDVNGKQGDFITTVSPGVEISGTTKKVQAFIDYTLNGLVFWNNSELSDIRHDLSAAVNTEVIDNRFFVDLRGAVRQNFQNFGGQVTNIQENFTNNRFTQQTYAVTPRWREEIGNLAVAQLSYTFTYADLGPQGLVTDGTTFASNAIGHIGNFSLRSGSKFDRLNWTWNTSYQNSERQVRDLRFESYSSILDLDYSLNRKWALLGSIGYEDIRDDTLAATQSGVIGDVGARFRPGPRTQIEGRVGRRFGDTVFSARASYAFSVKDTLEASYSENLTIGNLNELSRLAQTVDSDGDGIPDFALDGGPIVGTDGFITDAAFRQKAANLTFTRQLRRTSIATTAFWQKRIFGTDNDFSSYGASVTGQYSIDGAQTVSSQLIYRHNEFQGGIRDDFVAFSPAYTFAFSPNLNASVRYNYTKRFSGNTFLNRTTNSLSASLTAFF